MHRILKTILTLLLLLIAVSIINKKLQQKIIANGLKLNTKDEILIFGDSHGACSFNPKYIENSKNFSNWGESLLFTYAKLKKIIKANPEQKDLKVILTFSYHTIYKCRENYNIEEQRGKILQEYYPLIEKEEFDIVKRSGTEYFLTKLKFDYGLPFSFKTNIEKVMGKKSFFTAGFENTNSIENATKDHSEKKIIDHFGEKPKKNESEILCKYLNKIIDLAEENNIKVTLVNTPKSKFYMDLLPAEVKSNYESIKNKVLQKYSNVIFYDFSNTISDTKLFRDSDHLNSFGAKEFSKKMDSCMKI